MKLNCPVNGNLRHYFCNLLLNWPKILLTYYSLIMRFRYFIMVYEDSRSSNMHMQLASGAVCLNFCLSFCLCSYFVFASSEGVIIFANSTYPDEMLGFAVSHLGLHCFPFSHAFSLFHKCLHCIQDQLCPSI